jgi:hypothetical protein
VSDDIWQNLMVTVFGGIIVSLAIMFIPIKQHSVYSYLKKNRPNNYFSNVTIPDEIPINRLTNISVTFFGSLKDGFITCEIKDSLNQSNWCEDKTTVRNLDQGRQIGKLNYKRERHTYRWAVLPEPKLRKGKGRLEIGAYDTEERVPVALEIKEILLV